MSRTLKEKFLYNRLKKQDQQAFAEVYDLFVEKIYRFVYFKVGSQEEAQDLTSEVFLKAWHSSQVAGQVMPATLPAFLYRVARTTVIDHYRTKRHEASLDDMVELDDEPAVDEALSKDFDRELDKEILEQALAQLKDEYRDILVMRYIDELSTTEIASVLDKSKVNVRVLQHRALEALKKILK